MFGATTYRNPSLLALARHAPHCMNPGCRANQEGQVVAAHSNSLAHGKGMGHKAHDIPAYLCDRCHHLVDGRPEGGPLLPKAVREAMFLSALYETILWLLQSGHLQVKP